MATLAFPRPCRSFELSSGAPQEDGAVAAALPNLPFQSGISALPSPLLAFPWQPGLNPRSLNSTRSFHASTLIPTALNNRGHPLHPVGNKTQNPIFTLDLCRSPRACVPGIQRGARSRRAEGLRCQCCCSAPQRVCGPQRCQSATLGPGKVPGSAGILPSTGSQTRGSSAVT